MNKSEFKIFLHWPFKYEKCERVHFHSSQFIIIQDQNMASDRNQIMKMKRER
jgi:hypothetical protein